ncbi:hypothetical protein ACSBR1_030924 [Camellia fascicularis]
MENWSGLSQLLREERGERVNMVTFKEIWVKKTLLGLGLGQFLSFLITSTGFSSSELARRGINAPTSQTSLNYVFLAIVYGGILLYRRQALKAYQYTSLTSVMLLDCWSIPSVILLTWFFLKTKYRYRKFAGVAICVAGLVVIIFSDVHAKDRSGGSSPLKGDMLVILGSTLYAISNVSEEFFVKSANRVELMAMLGILGAIISDCQISILERNELKAIHWSSGSVIPFIGFAVAMFLFYSGVPLLLKICGSTMLNLSLLTSDMWTVLIRIFAYHEKVDWMYFVAFAAVAVGLVIYSGGDKEEDKKRADVADEEGPACFDALSAKLVERAGFDFCFATGFGISASRLGLPDTGLISYGEMVDQGHQITQAVSIPIIGDGDNGYGNAMNVKRTVKGYISAVFAGIVLEDQVSPKACGHTQGRKVVSRQEAVTRIIAAVDARKESGSDIVIVTQTDSRQAVSFDESIWRFRALADAGADVLFIDALASKEEMKAFCDVYPLIPKMANMLEGGGKTPILNPIELGDLGYKLVAYPLSLIGVSIRAMEDALTAIKGGRVPPPGSMPSFEEVKEILGFNTYYEEEKQCSTSTGQLSPQRPDRLGTGYLSTSSNAYGIQQGTQEDTDQRDQNPRDPVIEVITPDVYNNYGADGTTDPFSGIWSRTL